MPFLSMIGDKPGLIAAFAAFKAHAKTLLLHSENVMRGPSPLSATERELIAAFVSVLNGCKYCVGMHVAAAEAMGIEKGLVQALAEDLEAANVDEKTRALLRYVRKLTRQPAEITGEDAESVLAAGWSEQQFHDAVAVTAHFNYMNRYVEGLGVEADQEFYDRAGPGLKDAGYASILKIIGAD